MPAEKGPEHTKETRGPELLDIVKIDGRWAQVIGSGDMVKFLSTGVAERIDWGTYQLVKAYKGRAVKLVEELDGEIFSPDEIVAIHWGADVVDPAERIRMAREVSVFGVFEKKQ